MPTIRRTFRSLQTRNYRLFYAGQLVSVSGSWCQVVALSWLVYSLTGSGVALGVITGLPFVPSVLLGPWGGLLADRFDKRRVLMASNAFMAVVAALLAGLTLAGVVEVWHLYVLALLQGIGTAFEIPARHSFVNELVAPEDLPNAVGLNSALFNVSRVVGPAVAGVLISAVGSGWCFTVNAISFLAVIASYRRLRVADLHPVPRTLRGKGQLREGLVVALRTPETRRTIVSVGLFSLLGFNFPVLLPILADRTYDGGSSLFATLTMAMAVGSVVGALVVASRRRPSDRFILGTGVLYGLSCVVAAASTDLRLALPPLVLAGALGISFLSTSNARTQLAAPPAARGRVLAIYTSVFLGATPIASPVVGWLAEAIGARTTLAAGGAAAMTVIAVTYLPVVLRDRPAQALEVRPA